MRKAKTLILVILLMGIFCTQTHASDSWRSERGYFGRLLTVEARGLLGAVAAPLELVRTPVAERINHKWLWPVTFLPRFVNNIVTRVVSSIYDIAAYPFILPFSNDITPLTDPMGLPDYAWQLGDSAF
ncbi:MAG: hypothetical protein COW13_03125 [Candidatus Omnitrophica bacterium CG12_big_fil_rev_8_21_14_0_65_50_5]|nr:MAG: hypothetical protein COW13_03125 [Candidatus Omnitrophica bacterium CG12_big_fil_rev_8_21_14_0_65_50_5]